jgi:protein-S-isoprenylcysteine O-methyltransferase Ste14
MRTTHAKHGGADVHVPPPLVFLAAILVGVALQHVVPIALDLSRAARWAAGGVLLVAGLAFAGSAARLFRRTGQDPAPWKPSPSLVASGPYRFSRNPMYVGMTALTVGIGLALGNPWVAGLAAIALTVVHYTAVVREERYLAEKFGDDYARLRTKVRRYL